MCFVVAKMSAPCLALWIFMELRTGCFETTPPEWLQVRLEREDFCTTEHFGSFSLVFIVNGIGIKNTLKIKDWIETGSFYIQTTKP